MEKSIILFFPQRCLYPHNTLPHLMLVETLNSGMLKPCLTVMSSESYPHFYTHVCTNTLWCFDWYVRVKRSAQTTPEEGKGKEKD